MSKPPLVRSLVLSLGPCSFQVECAGKIRSKDGPPFLIFRRVPAGAGVQLQPNASRPESLGLQPALERSTKLERSARHETLMSGPGRTES